MSASEKELEFVMRNVEVIAGEVTRKITGKTAADFMRWKSQLLASDVGPEISFLLMGMEDFD